MPSFASSDPAATLAAVTELIAAHVRDSAGNRMHRVDDTPIFDAPLVGVAAGDDPLFVQYQQIIGPFHLLPAQVAAHAWGSPGESVDPHGLAVICWVLPVTAKTRESNYGRHDPSERWAYTRYDGEIFNDELREFVVAALHEAGHHAVAPTHSDLFRTVREDAPRPPVSTWSERHALYAAGLGTFSLNDGFITPRGIAMRCGSVVTDLPLAPTPRSYANHTANCLYLSEGTCGACIARCPAGAISSAGHDKALCSAYLNALFPDLRKRMQTAIYGCGLCQTDVPCEHGIPTQA